MSLVETALGPVEADRLGRTLAHEHIINVTDWIARDYPDVSWNGDRAEVVTRVRSALQRLKSKGFDTVMDCTAMGHSRDTAAVVEANTGVGVNIILSTGVYAYDSLPLFFKYRPPQRADDGSLQDILIDFFVRDIREGIQGTGAKAALIKCVTDVAGVTPGIDRVLRATAHAHRETGAPITTHTNAAARSGLEQQRVFREEGVDLTRVLIGHCGDTDDYDYLRRLLDAGSFIGADRFGLTLPGWGMPTLEKRINIVRTLIDQGYEKQILLSQDTSLYTDWWPGFGNVPDFHPPEWRIDYIADVVVSAMRAAGISEHAIEAMLIGNPRRFLQRREAY